MARFALTCIGLLLTAGCSNITDVTMVDHGPGDQVVNRDVVLDCHVVYAVVRPNYSFAEQYLQPPPGRPSNALVNRWFDVDSVIAGPYDGQPLELKDAQWPAIKRGAAKSTDLPERNERVTVGFDHGLFGTRRRFIIVRSTPPTTQP